MCSSNAKNAKNHGKWIKKILKEYLTSVLQNYLPAIVVYNNWLIRKKWLTYFLHHGHGCKTLYYTVIFAYVARMSRRDDD